MDFVSEGRIGDSSLVCVFIFIECQRKLHERGGKGLQSLSRVN